MGREAALRLGVSALYASLCSRSLSLVLLPHRGHRGRSCSPLTLLEGSSWSLPSIIHGGPRLERYKETSLEGLDWRQQKRTKHREAQEADDVALKVHLPLEAPD